MKLRQIVEDIAHGQFKVGDIVDFMRDCETFAGKRYIITYISKCSYVKCFEIKPFGPEDKCFDNFGRSVEDYIWKPSSFRKADV